MTKSIPAGWHSVDSTRQSDNFPEVLAKSIYKPSELNPSEILQLDAYYTGILDQIESAKANWETGTRTSHWQKTIDFLAPTYFGNEFSRSWWKLAKKGYAESEGEDFVTRIDAALSASDSNRQKKVISQLQKSTN